MKSGGCVCVVNFALCLAVEQCVFVILSPPRKSHQDGTPFGPSTHARKAAICQQIQFLALAVNSR